MSFFEKLLSEMNELSNRIYETPEFKSLDEVKLTIERARFYAAHAVYFNMNRRDCWGHVQGSVPWDVKRVIWKHEEDELISDPRGGADHRSLLFREADALGISQGQVESLELNAGVLTAFMLGCTWPRTQPGFQPLLHHTSWNVETIPLSSNAPPRPCGGRKNSLKS